MITPRTAAAEPLREPTEKEARAIAAAQVRAASREARPSLQVRGQGAGAVQLGASHSDQHGAFDLLEDSLGTTSSDFAGYALLQLTQTSDQSGKGVSEQSLNAQIAIVAAVSPENELEAALAVQMAATHDLSMHLLAKAKNATRLDLVKEYGNLATKTTRTFAAQMKALSDLRRGGEQVVRHIHVHEGGQALVAETVHVGARNAQALDQCHALSPSLLGSHQAGDGMPIASGERAQALPHARGQEPRRTQGE